MNCTSRAHYCDVKGWQYKSSAEFKHSELLRVLDSRAQYKGQKAIAPDNYNYHTLCLSANASTHHLLGTGAKQFSVNISKVGVHIYAKYANT